MGWASPDLCATWRLPGWPWEHGDGADSSLGLCGYTGTPLMVADAQGHV